MADSRNKAIKPNLFVTARKLLELISSLDFMLVTH